MTQKTIPIRGFFIQEGQESLLNVKNVKENRAA